MCLKELLKRFLKHTFSAGFSHLALKCFHQHSFHFVFSSGAGNSYLEMSHCVQCLSVFAISADLLLVIVVFSLTPGPWKTTAGYVQKEDFP